jgi:hypothetical protein
MKKQFSPLLALTVLSLTILSRPVHAQFTTSLSLGANNPLRRTVDSLPGIRTGFSISLHPGYTFQRFNVSSTIGYQTLNTGNGFEALAQQNGYTREKGFTLNAKSGSLINLALGAGYNLLPVGNTACGLPKLSLLLGAQGGILITAGKVDGQVKNKAGETAFALQQTGKTTTPFYRVSLELLCPVSNTLALSTAAAWSRAASDLALQHSNNGGNSISHFTYSDLQVSIGVQITFKGIHSSGQPQARTTGQPIGGIVVKGGVNPGSKPKPHNMVAGNPIPGVVVKGGKLSSKTNSLVYTEDFVVENETLRNYLGTDQLIIEKGEYNFDYSANPEGRVILHLHSQGIIHRDLAARSFVFEGTDPDGKTFTYSVEPVYIQGVAKDILITYKGITEKGIK